MSYEKHTWQTGETITAEKLNNLEDGIASNSGESNDFVVSFQNHPQQENKRISDKTIKEIYDAYRAGKTVYGIYIINSDDGVYYNVDRFYLSCVSCTNINPIQYNVTFFWIDMNCNVFSIRCDGEGSNYSWTVLTSNA